MTYTWLLFDIDGTLFDYDRAESTALRLAFDESGMPFEPVYLNAYRTINGEIWQEFERGEITSQAIKSQRFARFFDAIGVSFDPLAFGTTYLWCLAQQATLIDGAEETIRRLHDRYRLFLLTNGLKEVQRERLARSTLKDYFEGIVISDEVGVSKPDGRIFDIAFQLMGNPDRAEVLMIGDSTTSDMAGAVGYGIDTCWFNASGKPAPAGLPIDYEISNLSELPLLLEKTELEDERSTTAR
ncbi:MAG: YjjG family noncanonical pyrimidine nucleotidase [Chloroflexota bacterium]|nr:YjjG family noncanonical pyrimidine nucleotidase [Chloroflexota bacterium]